jgi:dipeptidyl aminopeptidase/acylaminoacyl peptidase
MRKYFWLLALTPIIYLCPINCSHDPNIPVDTTGTPKISVEPIVLDFEVPQGAIGARRITISNTGEDTLHVTSIDYNDLFWLSIYPEKFDVAPNDSREISLEVNTTSLTDNFYSRQIKIKSDDPDRPSVTVVINVNVTGKVVGAEIDVDKTILKAYVVEGQIGQAKFSVYSQGKSDLLISQITSTFDWLSFVPSSGTIPGGQKLEITAVFSAQNLLPSSYPYPDTAIVYSNDYDEPRYSIPVQLYVVASNLKPDIDVTPLSRTVDVEPNAVYNFDIIIGNTGHLDVNVSDVVVNPPDEWLSIDRTTVSVPSGEQRKIKVTINTEGMQDDAEGTLSIYSNDPDENPVIVHIKLNMSNANKEAITFTPENMSLVAREGQTNSDYIKLANNSQSPINISRIYGLVAWLNAEPTSLTLAAKSEALVKVIADAFNLSSGRYNSLLELVIADTSIGNKTVPVNLSVVPGQGGDLSPPATVTNFSGDEIMPSCSWDGLFLTYVYNSDTENKIEIIRYNGDDRKTIITSNGYKDLAHPDWHPMDSLIVFDALNLGTRDIIITNLKGNTEVIIPGGSNDFYPRWSPDGNRIAFVSDRSGNYDIWTCDRTGNDLKKVTSDPEIDRDPYWGMTGNTIVFTTARDGNYDIWETLATGESATPIIQHPNLDRYPSVSGYGWLVFASFRTGNWDLWLLDLVSNQLQNLTSAYSDEQYSCFDKYGSRLFYSSNKSGDYNIYMIEGF